MDFDAGRARSFAALLSRPRGCGTPDERWAADRVREAFRDAGLETREEWFHFRAAGDATVRVLLLLALGVVGLMWAGGAWWPPVAGFGAAAGVVLAAVGRRLATTLLMSGVRDACEADRPADGAWRCSNVVGDAPGPAEGPLLVFTAHYDSKSQNLPIAVRALLFTLLVPAGLATAALGAARALGADPPLAALHAAAAVALAAALPLLALRTGNASPGALDNACGLAVLVEIARLWRRHPASRRARARFVATGAEEHGLIGARVHLRRGLAELRRESRCWILNLDGCATPGALRVLPGRGRRSGGFSVPEALAAGGVAAGHRVRPLRAVGILADHVPFVEAGLSCATLLAYGKGTWRIHTEGDGVELLEDGAFRAAGEVVLGAVGVLLGSGGSAPRG